MGTGIRGGRPLFRGLGFGALTVGDEDVVDGLDEKQLGVERSGVSEVRTVGSSRSEVETGQGQPGVKLTVKGIMPKCSTPAPIAAC